MSQGLYIDVIVLPKLKFLMVCCFMQELIPVCLRATRFNILPITLQGSLTHH